MKKIIALCIFWMVIGFVNIASANPGIEVTTGLPSYSVLGDNLVAEYVVTIQSLDAGYDTDGDGVIDCCAKIITSTTVEQDGWSDSDWSYLFYPDPTTLSIPADYGIVTTTLTIVAPSSTGVGDYSHKVNVDAKYDLYIPDDPSTSYDETLFIPEFGIDNDYHFFYTAIAGSTLAPIPEFPTVALPIISALGLLFLMRRGK